MSLTDAQRSACMSLDDALQCSRSGSSVDTESSDPTNEQDWYSCLEVTSDEREDSDVEEYEDGNTSLTDEPAPPPAHRQIANSPLQFRILNLLISLFTQLPTGNDDKFFSPILRFAVLASLQSSGKWLPPRQITHPLAVLLFCGQEVMMALMHQRLVEDSTIRYSKYVVRLA